MSYDVYLMKDEGIARVVPHQEGATIVVGGDDSAELNVTYNYGKFYYDHLDKQHGLKWLHKKKAQDTIERLEAAVKELGTERDGDYWAATAGNAGHALFILLSWAKQHPDAIFDVV